MRTNKELLQIVIDSLKEGDKPDFYNSGICGEIENLYDLDVIDSSEANFLEKFVIANRQRAVDYFGADEYGLWWWEYMRLGAEHREIRIKFLESLL